MKRWNRKNEFLGYSAEAAAVVAKWLGGAKYDQARLNEAWRLVLGAQFHDILPGTSIPGPMNFPGMMRCWQPINLNRFLRYSAGAVSRGLDTLVTGRPLVIYNPLAFDREDIVEAEVTFPQAVTSCRVFGPDGLETPSQIKDLEGNKVKIILWPEFHRWVSVSMISGPPLNLASWLPALKLKKQISKNLRYLVKINRDGDVSSIYDKRVIA